jgi:hypothetical protein
MSMIMQYVRIQPDELVRLRRLLVTDRNRAYDYVDELADTDPWRSLDTDRAWAGLDYLLNLAGPPPVDVIYGDERLTDDEWGYGPPRLLTGADVTRAADFLDRTPFDLLAAHLDPDSMTGIYPGIWQRAEAGDYLRTWYRAQQAFFHRAAAHGDALVVYLS